MVLLCMVSLLVHCVACTLSSDLLVLCAHRASGIGTGTRIDHRMPAGRNSKAPAASCTWCVGPMHVVGTILLYVLAMLLVANPVRGDLVLANAAQCANPHGIAISSNGSVIVACSLAGPTAPNAVISISGSTITQLIDYTQCQASEVASNPTNNDVYSTCINGQNPPDPTVLAFTETGVTTLATFAQCPFPSDIAVSSDGVIYVACQNNNNGSFLAITGTNVVIILNDALCKVPTAVAVVSTNVLAIGCPAGIFSVSISGPTLTLIDGGQCPNPAKLAVTSNRIVAACNSIRGIFAIPISGGAGSQIATSGQCPNANGVSVNPIDNLLYASCGSSANLISINGTIVTQLTTSPNQCGTPTAVATNPTNSAVYALCDLAGGTVISLKECVQGEFYSPLSSPVCVSCSVGRYQYHAGQTACTNCSAGTFGLAVGASSPASCTLCGPGTQNPIAGLSDPRVCIPSVRESVATI